MKLMTYNVMEGGVKPDHSRLEKVLRVIAEQDADTIGLQETLLTQGKENELITALRASNVYPQEIVFDGVREWAQTTGVAMLSKYSPSSAQVIGERVKAVEMIFPTTVGDFSISNIYLSHISEATRLPQVKEVLQELSHRRYSVLMGDFNALSPEDELPKSAVAHFSSRMKEKYCREGEICYETIEEVLGAGYVDVGLQFYQPEEITDKTDLSGGTGTHTQPMRMDFFFVKPEVLPYVKEFALVNKGLVRTASDHFPWHMTLESTLFQ